MNSVWKKWLLVSGEFLLSILQSFPLDLQMLGKKLKFTKKSVITKICKYLNKKNVNTKNWELNIVKSIFCEIIETSVFSWGAFSIRSDKKGKEKVEISPAHFTKKPCIWLSVDLEDLYSELYILWSKSKVQKCIGKFVNDIRKSEMLPASKSLKTTILL